MQQRGWVRYLVAALVVLVVGAIWALAEETEVKVEVRNESGREITIDVNGESEVIHLDDLDEGESLDHEVGGRTFTVRRIDDRLLMDHDGPGTKVFFVGEDLPADARQVWVTKDEVAGAGSRQVVIMEHGEGDDVDLDFDVKVDEVHGARSFVVISGDEGELDLEALKERYGDDFDEIVKDDGTRILRWVGDGREPGSMVFYSAGFGGSELVRYRCDDTGSMLLVKKQKGLLDSYIDPVTGCLLERVDDGIRVHVVKVRERLEDDREE